MWYAVDQNNDFKIYICWYDLKNWRFQIHVAAWNVCVHMLKFVSSLGKVEMCQWPAESAWVLVQWPGCR